MRKIPELTNSNFVLFIIVSFFLSHKHDRCNTNIICQMLPINKIYPYIKYVIYLFNKHLLIIQKTDEFYVYKQR